MTHTTKQAPNGRGCGTRDTAGVYLCLGIGPFGTLTVEDLILDPVKIWPGEWQRGFKILPNKLGWNDVGIFISKEDYPSFWDFVEEVRLFGISRKVSPTFPFEQLTPGQSRMVFIHARGYPRFDYVIETETPLEGCKWFPLHDGLGREVPGNEQLWANTMPGYHPKIETETKCTFAHQHLAGRIHNTNYGHYGEFTIEMPSFSYSGYYPIVKFESGQDDMTWDVAAFMVAPLSHLEFPKKLNKSAAERANKAGYETIVTEW